MFLDEGMRLGLELPGFDVSRFLSARDGSWIEAGRSSTYQAITGGGISTDGDPVGFAQDLAETNGLALDAFLATQADLATNGDFATGDLTGWEDPNAHWSVVSGEARHPSSGTAYRPLLTDLLGGLAVGTFVYISFDYDISVGGLTLKDRTISNTALAQLLLIDGVSSGTQTFIYQKVATAHYLAFGNKLNTDSVFTIDNVTVKVIPSIPATQATSGARPTFEVSAPAHFIHDGVDDELEQDFTGTNLAGETCTVVEGCTDGVVVHELAVPSGVLSWRPNPLYSPSNNVMGRIYAKGSLSDAEVAGLRQHWINQGSAGDFSAKTTAENIFRSRTELRSVRLAGTALASITNWTNGLVDTGLTATGIDNLLSEINAAGTSGGVFNQSGGSAPGAAGQSAIDALRLRSWTISVTGGY